MNPQALIPGWEVLDRLPMGLLVCARRREQGTVALVVSAANAAACALLGRPAETCAGRPAEEVLPGLPQEPLRRALEEGDAAPVEIFLQDPGGVGQRLLLRALPVGDDRAVLILDVPDSSKERMGTLDAMVSTAPALIWMTGIDRNMTFYNERWLTFTGRTLQEQQGDGWLWPIHPCDRPRVEENYDKMLEAQERFTIEYRLRRHDGAYRWVLDEGVPWSDATGKFAGHIGIALDITDRRQAEMQIRKLAFDLQQVAEISAFLSTVLDPARLIQDVVELTTIRFQVYDAALFLLHEADGVLELVAEPGEAGVAMVKRGYRIPLEEQRSIIARAARTRKSIIVPDVRAEPDYMPIPLLPDSRSEITVPLLLRGRVLGVLNVESNRLNHFTDQDAAILTTLGGQVAAALENARLFAALRESEARFRTLALATPVGVFETDAAGAITYLNERTAALVGVPVAEMLGRQWMDVLDEKDIRRFRREWARARPPARSMRMEFRIKRPDGAGAWVIGEAVARTGLSGEVTGFIGTLTDVTELKTMHEEIHALSITDELTGLYNRRGFFTLAEKQLKKAVHDNRGLFLVFADLDHLKVINDTFGHIEGDQALRDAARIFQETFRETDIIARVGGDEFAVFPVGAADSGSMEIIRGRLQKRLHNHNAQPGRRYRLSLSLGMAFFDPEHPCSLDELLLRSDKLMYEQKRKKS